MSKPYEGPWVIRSMLFIPGHIDKMLNKGPSTAADCVVLDLEDAVPPNETANARGKIRSVLEAGEYANKSVFVRVNPIASGKTLRDLDGVACRELNGFVYPMAGTADDIKAFAAQLSLIEAHLGLENGHFSVIPLVETPRAVLNAHSLATASDRVVALLFGCEDYLAEMEARYGDDDISLHTPRSMVALAARAADIVPIDTPYVRVHDLDGLRVFAGRARDIGMAGMLVMTPRQIPVAHEVYTPTDQEVAAAEKMVAAAEKTRKEGKGIAVVDGQFVSPPTVKASRRVLARARAIENLEISKS